jgi:hypothetical protein
MRMIHAAVAATVAVGILLLAPAQPADAQTKATSKVTHWPSWAPLFAAGTSEIGDARVLTGSSGIRRTFRVQRAIYVPDSPLTWTTTRRANTQTNGWFTYRLSVPNAGLWRFRIVVEPTRTARGYVTRTLSVRAVVGSTLLRPRDLHFVDESTIKYVTGPQKRPALRVRNLATGVETLYSSHVHGVTPNGPSGVPVPSPDGTKLAFWSDATNLVPGEDANHSSDLFLKDIATGSVVRVDTGPWGTQQGGHGSYLDLGISFSPDGNQLAFRASKLYAYIYDIGTATATEIVSTACGVGDPVFSPDGTNVYLALIQWSGVPDNYSHPAVVNLETLEAKLLDLRADNTVRFSDSDVYSRGLLDPTHLLLDVSVWPYGPSRYWVKNLTSGTYTKGPSSDYDATRLSRSGKHLLMPTRDEATGDVVAMSVRRMIDGVIRYQQPFRIPQWSSLSEMTLADSGRWATLATPNVFAYFQSTSRVYDFQDGTVRRFVNASIPVVSDGGRIAFVRDDRVVVRY